MQANDDYARIWRLPTAEEVFKLQYLNSLIQYAKTTSKRPELPDTKFSQNDNQCIENINCIYNAYKLQLKSDKMQLDGVCDWILMSKGQRTYKKFKMENLVIPHPRIFMIEMPKKLKYIRNHLEYECNWRIQLRIGSKVECLDRAQPTPKWYEAFVKDVRDFDNYENGLYREVVFLWNRHFEIKFDGYSDRHNIWLKFDSPRLAPMYTHLYGSYW